MTNQSICMSPLCGHNESGAVRDCPRCGRRMRTSAAVRRLGVLGIVCGLVIVGMMGTITWNMSWVLKHPGQQDYGGSRFTGDAAQAAMILQLFWVVICFGVAAIGAGLLQAVTGRRHRFVGIGVLVLGAILFLVARQTMVALR